MRIFLALLLVFGLWSCQGQQKKAAAPAEEEIAEAGYPVTKTDAEWRATLTDLEYYILRRAGTETPFSSDLLDVKEAGTFVCAACQTPLFKSEHKVILRL